MLSSGQLLGHEEREPISPAIPEEGICEVKYTNRRTNVVRLLPNGFQERKLRRLASTSTKLFNEVNYERRQQFFHGEKVDFKGTWDKYYEKYRDKLGGANAQAVIQKNNEAWNSFFSLLKLKKEGKLLPHMKHVGPPKYWKDGETEKRKLLGCQAGQICCRRAEPQIVLKDFDLEVEFVGRLKWYGKQGRLEIHSDETKNAWYASIPVEVGVEETKTGKKSKHIVRGERKSIQVESPRGNKVASIDLGINVLASVVLNDGTWLLYKGVRTKEDYFYFEKRIAQVQSLADKRETKVNMKHMRSCWRRRGGCTEN
jgi:putative transposase